MQWYSVPLTRADFGDLQLHCYSAVGLGAHSGTTNVGISLVGEDILPKKELWVLRFNNRNVVNSQRKVIMELQYLPLLVASKFARCAVSYPTATQRPCLVDGKPQLFAEPGQNEGIR